MRFQCSFGPNLWWLNIKYPLCVNPLNLLAKFTWPSHLQVGGGERKRNSSLAWVAGHNQTFSLCFHCVNLNEQLLMGSEDGPQCQQWSEAIPSFIHIVQESWLLPFSDIYDLYLRCMRIHLYSWFQCTEHFLHSSLAKCLCWSRNRWHFATHDTLACILGVKAARHSPGASSLQIQRDKVHKKRWRAILASFFFIRSLNIYFFFLCWVFIRKSWTSLKQKPVEPQQGI